LLEADRLKTAQLKDELIALRLQLKTQRSDRMAQLTEAITIANALGLKKPATPLSLINAEVNAQQPPLYFMGTDALEAERSMLKQRKSDDFTEVRIAAIIKELELLQVNREVEVLNQRVDEDVFLHDLEPLRSEVSRLSNLDFDTGALKLVTIDQLAFQPLEPIKPNKKLILLSSLLLGLMLGTGLALIRYFVAVRPSSASHSFP
jgi:LPS O-antigen subunit length determinant protein (WzzB/FepE family)